MAIEAGMIDAVICSPPYADSVNASSHGIDWNKMGPATGNRKRGSGCKHEQTFRDQLAYGITTEGQIGAMKATHQPEATEVGECVMTDQHGLYDGSWKGVCVDDAFAHP